ncbi:MAG: aspartate aminotransferase family protein [Chlorobi bacterium]|nr:aspartate aminotransferase family protein [Chlorobiota bacterium]
MLTLEEFRQHAHKVVDWMTDYYKRVEELPVKSLVSPGDIYGLVPENPPEDPEAMDKILNDFDEKIIPGITHWQSPDFFAYFPANSSYPSVLAEMITATLGTQCMIWETSPAAAELEEKMMNWLKKMIGFPSGFQGVIQDTASTATLAALITAREVKSNYTINEKGFGGNENYRIYASEETHSSIEKAVKIAGFGRKNLVKAPVKRDFTMDTQALEQLIRTDLNEGYTPLAVIATLGTTGTTSVDPLGEIAAIADEFNLWLHVDAALAGSALILPEYRWMTEGIERVDSFVFNPHKWLFTNFDCSVYFVRDTEALIRTFEILPEYLKTGTRGAVNDYRDWGIPLGRRFRALKLWFVIRNYGLSGLQEALRNHIRLAGEIKETIKNSHHFELMAPAPLNTVCFRFNPGNFPDEELNNLNAKLLEQVNRTGKAYFTHTKLHGNFVIRFMIGQTNTKDEHVYRAWELIDKTAASLI